MSSYRVITATDVFYEGKFFVQRLEGYTLFRRREKWRTMGGSAFINEVFIPSDFDTIKEAEQFIAECKRLEQFDGGGQVCKVVP